MVDLSKHKWKSFKDEFPDVNNPEHATAVICVWKYEAEDFPEEYEYHCFNLGLSENNETLLWNIPYKNTSDYYSKYNLPDYEYWDYIK